MKRIIALIVVFWVTTAEAQDKKESIKPFVPREYPSSMFNIRYDTVHFRQFTICLVHVLNTGYKGKLDATYTLVDSNYFDCRGWVFIERNGKIIHTIYYSNMNAVGGCSGIYLPHEQPRIDYFLIVKNGDYDGKIIILDSLGHITTEEGGGSIQVSSDKRYLFSDYDSDLQGTTIYDFSKHHTVLKADSFPADRSEPIVELWYYQEGKYMARVLTDDEKGENPDTLHITVGVFDFTKRRITLIKKNKGFLKDSNLLRTYDYYPPDGAGYHTCNCGR